MSRVSQGVWIIVAVGSLVAASFAAYSLLVGGQSEPVGEISVTCTGFETTSGTHRGSELAPETRSIARTFRFFMAEREIRSGVLPTVIDGSGESEHAQTQTQNVWVLQVDDRAEIFQENSTLVVMNLPNNYTETRRQAAAVSPGALIGRYSRHRTWAPSSEVETRDFESYVLNVNRLTGEFSESTVEQFQSTDGGQWRTESVGTCVPGNPKF
jgi:hypothetical protein